MAAAPYTMTELLAVYQRAYLHLVEIPPRNMPDPNEYTEMVCDVAKFGSWIATAPLAKKTQLAARKFDEDIDFIHATMKAEMEAGRWSYPCVCLYDWITSRRRAAEDAVDALGDNYLESDPQVQKLLAEFDMWMAFQKRQ